MPKYIIEREIPGAGRMNGEELHALAKKSRAVLRQLGSEIQWIESHIAGDKVFCSYIAANVELIREHARLCGIPADRISEIKQVIDPATADILLL